MMQALKNYCVTMLLLIAAPAVAHAQNPPLPPPPASAPPPSTGKPSATQAAVEQRITALQTKLAITPDQQAAWSAFAQVMRDNAQSTDTSFQQRAQGAATMSAVDNMKSYAAITRTYADNTQRLATAFETLYGKLSSSQQQIADTLFRQPSSAAAKKPLRR
jgi:protein CpxP